MTADAGIHDPACDCKQCVTAQRDLLRDFARAVMQAWPEGGIDGGELQDIALAHECSYPG